MGYGKWARVFTVNFKKKISLLLRLQHDGNYVEMKEKQRKRKNNIILLRQPTVCVFVLYFNEQKVC